MKNVLTILGFILVFIILIFLFFTPDEVIENNVIEPDYKKFTCENFIPEKCPGACAVCPPCIECSSITCQTVEFCESIGFSKDWYENLEK